ncbi:MAG: hypothetical protein IJD04_00030 [Desulfovibrionaceae bacterium]|nr:hypothetical protein [Desulfovibrionaceae bacterium]
MREKLTSAIERALAALYGDDNADGAAGLLSDAAHALGGVSRADEQIQELSQKVTELMYGAQEAAEELRDIKDGFDQTDADALFLDVREPWAYMDNVIRAVKPGAPLAFLVPTVDQISMLLKEFERQPVDDVEVLEILIRNWKTTPDRLRPEDRMVAHTGFLIFARYQESSPSWDANRKLGTRERKQEAARISRLEENADE